MSITDLVRINSTVLPKVRSYKVGRNKLWTDTGRSMSGELKATFVGIFPKLSIEFAPTTEEEMSTLTSLLDLPSFNVAWWDARTEGVKTGTYYAGDFEYGLFRKDIGLYDSFSVNLIPFRRMS